MQTFNDLLFGLGAWNWMIAALVLLGLEALIPGVHFVWFGVAAAIVGGLALTFDIAWQIQLVAFAVIALSSVFVMRGYAKFGDGGSDSDINVRDSEFVGRVVTVAEAISNGRGRVKVGDTLWWAEGPDTAAGSNVRVTAVAGTVLQVEPA